MMERHTYRDSSEEQIMYFVQSPANSCSEDHFLCSSSPTHSDSALFLNKNSSPQALFSAGAEKSVRRLIIVDDEEDDKGLWRRHCTFKSSDSWAWIFWQVSWRLAVSLGAALLVFYTATKPPPPTISIKMRGIPEFSLAEGVDGYGISTKILTCNSSINLEVENKSKLFGLHIHRPTMDITFGRLHVATTNGPKLYAESYGTTRFGLWVGIRNKALYGAGRNMQDMLDSRSGLPLTISVSFTSNFRLLWRLIQPSFHHRAQCLLLLNNAYDKRHRTQQFKSTCTNLT